MTKKSRSFSIYLLKDGVEDHKNYIIKEKFNILKKVDTAIPKENNKIIEHFTYVGIKESSPPWWKEYLNIETNLSQRLEDAICFLKVRIKTENNKEKERWFALTFGRGYYYLDEYSYEHDFGLRTTLNAVDPEKIKTTDTKILTTEIKEKRQSITYSKLNAFDLSSDHTIIKSIQGKIKDEYKHYISNHITGSSSLHFNSRAQIDELGELCETLFNIYSQEKFKDIFPEFQKIMMVSDPNTINILNKKLIVEFQKNNFENLALTIPETIDHDDIKYFYNQRKKEYDELDIKDYYNIRKLTNKTDINEKDFTRKNIDTFKKDKLTLENTEKTISKKYSIYKCFVFDCEQNKKHYYLYNGIWYELNLDFLSNLTEKLDPIFIPNEDFPHYKHKDEGEYNENTAKEKEWKCLDKKNISPKNETPVEPCDLLYQKNEILHLAHIKRGVSSSTLSHLFNQGKNSIELLRNNEESRKKLEKLINIPNDSNIDIDNAIIIYGIITSKPENLKSKALPLFSRISLYHVINTLRKTNIKCNVILIKNENNIE